MVCIWRDWAAGWAPRKIIADRRLDRRQDADTFARDRNNNEAWR